MIMNNVGKFIEKTSKMKNAYFAGFLLISLSIYFYFGFQHIGKFETADEHYWIYSPNYGRIYQYWSSLFTGNWAGTYINDKPGVTLALISGSALLFQQKSVQINEYERQIAVESTNNPVISEAIFSAFRIPIVVFNGIFSLLFLWMLWKISKNRWIALWGWLLILFSPVLLGISQIVNPDSLLWSFSVAVILVFFLFLETQEKKYAYLTSIFLAFSFLTKYVAIIFLPFFIFSVFVYFWFNFETLEKEFNKKFIRAVSSLILIFIGAAFVFILFIPGIFWRINDLLKILDSFKDNLINFSILAAIILFIFLDTVFLKNRLLIKFFKKTQTYSNILARTIYLIIFILTVMVLVNWASSNGFIPKIYKVQHDIEAGEIFRHYNLFQQILLELRLTLFSLTPIVLLGWLMILLKNIISKSKQNFFLIYLTIFILAFYIAIIQQQLLITIRYGIVLYPLISILATYGLYEASIRIRSSKIIATAVILIFSMTTLWQVKPFYFNYENFLLNKKQQITDAWGYGGYEAATFLNFFPNARELKVWADYRGFCAFFVGTCIRERDISGEYDSQVDYFIKTRRGSIIFNKRWENIKEFYIDDSAEPAWQMQINGQTKNYVKIYKNLYKKQ